MSFDYPYQNMDSSKPERSRQFQVLSTMNDEQYDAARLQDARKVAEDTSDMKEMMSDLGLLIRDQGTIIGGIEEEFATATENTQGAQNELIKAAERDNMRRRRKLMCYTCGGIVLLILVIYIYTHVFNK